MYLFEVKESTFKSFFKIGPSVLNKMVVLCQIKEWGRFCCHAHILIYFYVFLNVRYNPGKSIFWKSEHLTLSFDCGTHIK